MSALKPGLYRWSYGGKSYDGLIDGDGDFSYLGSDGRHCTRGYGVFDARPLIVLDLEDPAAFVRALGGCAPANPGDTDSDDFRIMAIANQIEAQTKPARIPEPGLWGIVKASAECERRPRHWLHDERGWATLSDAYSTRVTSFEYLIDPVLIREGLS